MKTLATIVIGFVVIVAALFFLSFSICAFVNVFGSRMSAADRVIPVVVAVVSLAVIIGGVSLIGVINRTHEPPE